MYLLGQRHIRGRPDPVLEGNRSRRVSVKGAEERQHCTAAVRHSDSGSQLVAADIQPAAFESTSHCPHLAPGMSAALAVDPSSALVAGVAPDSVRFLDNQPVSAEEVEADPALAVVHRSRPWRPDCIHLLVVAVAVPKLPAAAPGSIAVARVSGPSSAVAEPIASSTLAVQIGSLYLYVSLPARLQKV